MTNAQKKLMEHPDFDKVNIFMGGIYLLTSVQNLWWDEVEDILPFCHCTSTMVQVHISCPLGNWIPVLHSFDSCKINFPKR